MDTQNPVEEGILKLIEKGYNSTDVYNIMTQIGWQPDEVQLSMNELYERRAKENEAIARQRKEAIDKINSSYEDLKKKARPQQSDSFFGTFPGEGSSALDALDDIDSQVLNNASRSAAIQSVNSSASSVMNQVEQLNDLKQILASAQSTEEERRSAAKRLPKLEESIQSQYDNLRNSFAQTAGMGVNMDWGIDLDLDQDTVKTDGFRDLIIQSHMKQRDEIDSVNDLAKVSQNAYKEYMGVDFPEIESIGDLQNEITAMSIQRGIDALNQEQEEQGDIFEGYGLDDYAKAVEDQTWLSSTARGGREMVQSMWAGAMIEGIDVGNYLRENPALSAASRLIPIGDIGAAAELASMVVGGVEEATGFDSRLQLQHYFARQKEQDKIRKSAREREKLQDPSYWGLGPTERYEKINQDVESGKLDLSEAASMYGTVTGLFMEDIVPSAVYFGALSMMGLPGIGTLAASVSGQKYGDMLMERPDLNFGERLLIANTVGVAEAGLAYVFKGAEKAIAAPFMKLLPSSAIKQMGKESAKSGLRSVLPESLSKIGKALSPSVGEAFEEVAAYAIELGIENAVDSAAGRKTRDFNRYEFADAALGGLLGGAGMQGAGALVKSAANRGHHETRNRKLYLQGAINNLKREIARTPNGPERQELRKNLYSLNKEYRDLSAQETLTYGKYSVQDRSSIMKLNREIAFLEDQIKYKLDSRGKKLSKDQIEILESRLKSAMDAKVGIETQYESVSKTAAKHSKPETETSKDVEGNDVEVTSNQVSAKDTKTQQEQVPLAENSDPISQEGDQLALFDEKDFGETKVEEAPAEQEPVAEEAPVEEAPAEEPAVEETPTQDDVYSTSNEVDTEKGFDLADRERVGDDVDQISIASAAAFNKSLKGFKKLLDMAGSKVYVVPRSDIDAIQKARNPERFKEIRDKNRKIGGYYDVQNNSIVLASDAKVSSIQEEFGHAFMLPLINGQANPQLQQELYNALINDIEPKLKGRNLENFKAWKENREDKYKGQPTLKFREEMIIGFFKYYKDNVSDFKGITGYIKQAIHTVLKKAGHKGALPFREDSKLLNLAEAYSQMAEGVEADVDVTQEQFQEAQERAKAKLDKEEAKKRDDESEEEYRARIEKMVTEATGMPTPDDVAEAEARDTQEDQQEPPGIDDLFSIEGRKKFTYLKDTEVFYLEDPYVEIGDVYQGERAKLKKATFRDYFHFRNWYNYMTSNQRRPRVKDMYFIKDGKKYNVKPPKPKVDKDGKPVRMKGPETGKEASSRRVFERQTAQARKIKGARREIFDFAEEAKELMGRVGIDPASGMAFIPGFDYAAYSELTDSSDKFNFMSDFRQEIFSKTPEEIYEIAAIGRRNMELMKENGMSPEEMQAADKVDLFNMSAMKPESERTNGDIENDLFAIEEDDLPEKPHINKNKGLKPYDEGIISAIKDVFQIILTYDMSNGNMKGVNSGPAYLRKKSKVDGGTLISTHVDFNSVNGLIRRFTNYAKEVKRQTGRTEGEVGVGVSFLNPESITGNPDVFSVVMDGLFRSAQESLEETPGEGIHSSPAAVAKMLYKANRPGFKKATLMVRGALSPKTFDKVVNEDFNNFTIKDLKEVINALKEQQFSQPESFESRKAFLERQDVVDEFFRFVKYLSGRDITEVPRDRGVTKILDQYIDYFNDPAFKDVPKATLALYHKFPYKLSEDGKLEGLRIVQLPKGVGFGYALVSDMETDGLKVMKKVYELGDLNPGFKFKYEIKEGISKYESAQERALASGRGGSPFELNQLKKEGSKPEDSEAQDDMTSIEDDMLSQETDQGTFEMPRLTAFQKWRNLWIRRLVDKYNDIFDIQRAIESQKGRISKEMDFQMKEELMYGKAAQDLLNLDKKIEDIKKVMKDEGLSLETLNDYLYALHAKERNRVIKERIEAENEDRSKKKKKLLPLTDSGSGMSDADADAILNRIKPSQKKGLDKIEKMVRDIQNDTRSTMVDFGLESQETIDAWNDMFERYVPLAGIATDENSEATSSYPTGGAGLSVFGPMTKRARGRKSGAENVLAQVIAQNAATHVKARTNEAIRSLYELAEANPNQDIWQVMDEANSLDPHVVSVRIDGEQKFIRFKDASHAMTLKNMNLPETNLFIKILRAPSNWLRRSFTTLNPEFVVSNFARDIQTAVFNAAAESEIEGGIMNGEKVMKEIITTVPRALKSLLRGQVGLEQDAEMKRYYEEFREDGAKTGWAYAKRLNEIAAELEQTAGDVTRTQEILGVGKNMVDFVEGLNESFEDATRLAAYIAARRNGVSREKAAQLAKNITVNFNKHGEWGQALNGVYLFFNASVQGTSRMLRTIGRVKPATRPDGTTREWYERATSAQKMAAGLSLFSSMLAMINAGLSGEDEDDVLFYDKIPDYVKERNLILMNPRDGKTYYKIPLPYGFNIFSNIGTVSADVARGGMSADEGIYLLASGMVNAFSPISFGQSESFGRAIAKGGIPTVAKPLFDAWGFNETYFGGPVAAEQLPFGTKRPESSMSFRSPDSIKSFFEWMNEATGGSDRVSGKIDINPDRMWYVFEYFIGGAGNFVNRTGKTIKSVGGKFKDSDYDISVNDIPFVRIMYGEQSRYYDHGKYRDNETRIKQLHLERKDTKDWNNPRYQGVVELNNKLKAAEKKLKKLRDERKRAREIKDWTTRSIEVQKIMDQERKVIMEFNKRYNELRKD